MKATLTIEMDNAAFFDADGEPDQGLELARILRDAAKRLEAGEITFSLRDRNGNTVGSLEQS